MKKLSSLMVVALLILGSNSAILAQTVTVSAAGTASANGDYAYSTTYNGKNYYMFSGGYIMYWESGYSPAAWKIADGSGNGFYLNTSDTEFPPASGWEVDVTYGPGGSLPAPTLTGDVSLPVELVALRASNNGDIVILRWSTSTETNNYGFDVERRIVGGAWSAIGFVAGAGTSSSPHDYAYEDKNISAGTYTYRVKQINQGGSFKYYGNAEIEMLAPNKMSLGANFPNPFNPTTTFTFSLSSKSSVALRVFDALGREVSVVISEELPAGKYSRQWNAAELPSGVYFYRLQAGSFSETKKLLLMK